MASSPAAKKPKFSLLSERGCRLKNLELPLVESFYKYSKNKYDKETNPQIFYKYGRSPCSYAADRFQICGRYVQGIVNLGTSENKLLEDVTTSKLNENSEFKGPHTHYFAFRGTPSYLSPPVTEKCDVHGQWEVIHPHSYSKPNFRFRKQISEFLEHYMKPVEKINPDHIVAFNGCGSVIKNLASVICDPGDGILIPAPYYGGFDTDLSIEPGVVPFPVHLCSEPNPETKAPFELTVEDLEKALIKAEEQNVQIRALLLCNPHNPLGIIYSEKLIRQCMEFARKHSLHLISDEIYMLSIFKKGCSMTSALAICRPEINPEQLHILWGFSKDFGLSGLRAGIIYSRNTDVLVALKALEYFYPVPLFLQDVLGNFISDLEWLDNTLIPINHKRLRGCHAIVSDALKQIGVPLVEPCSGLFVWVDLRNYLHPLDFDSERNLGDILLDHGVYINPGYSFNCVEPGWFRIVIASDPAILKIGIERIVKVLKKMSVNPTN